MTAPIPYPQAGGWGSFVEPVVKRINLNVITGLTTTLTPENARALADLIRTMATRIDDPPIETMTVEQFLAGQWPASFLNIKDDHP